jgi:hypothetical protein
MAMTDDKRPGGENFAWVDPERTKPANAFDNEVGISGTGYSQESEREEGEKLPSGSVNQQATARSRQIADNDDQPDAGRRASFDPKTGEVRGSGAGAGGGNPGEDFDRDATAGDGYPITGGEGDGTSAPHDLGPPGIKH